MTLTPSDYIAASASLFALLSLFVAFRGYRISAMALDVARKEYHQTLGDVHLYLIHSVQMKRKDDDAIYGVFSLSFTNTATIPNTLNRLELIIHFEDEQGILRQCLIVPDNDAPLPEQANLSRLFAPINIAPRSTSEGWSGFKIPSHIINSKRIDHYTIRASTSDNRRVDADAYILMYAK